MIGTRWQIGHVLAALALAALCALPGFSAAAQGLFAPVAKVQDQTITAFELDQRQRFLSAIGGSPAPRELALDRLIEEKVQRAEARRLGVEIATDDILVGMDEFAGRANLDRAGLIAQLAQLGIAEETFRDFVEAGLMWRQIVRGRVGGNQHINLNDVNEALAFGNAQQQAASRVRVLISEIFLPARSPEERATADEIIAQIQDLRGFDAFSNAARQVSVAPSRDQGGRIDWLAFGNLPGPLREQILLMSPGQISDPVEVPNAVGLFQLRALSDTGAPAPVGGIAEFAVLGVPGSTPQEAREDAAAILERIDTCKDFYGEAQRDPDLTLELRESPVDLLAADIALALAPLDIGERTVLAGAESRARILMLCSRRLAGSETPDPDQVATALSNQRVQARADALLADLIARANIEILR
ncbi:MAG: peptidylprolyl isomerase [Alphaproteobacteria bacterium]|nr:peptidylprolyl isomerase [Alphaproteobacteria bacterium]NNF23391.1 peptidylprolyl isomerase [Paracoccaceae bacterium]